MNSDAQDGATIPSAIASGQATEHEQLSSSIADWPPLTPCEAAIHIGGTPVLARIVQLFSGRVGDSERVVSWAELHTDKEHIWTVFDGGYVEGDEYETSVSCGIQLERGIDVVLFDTQFAVDEDAEAVRPRLNSLGRMLPDGSLELVYGVINQEDVTDYLREFANLEEQVDACPFEFRRSH